MRKMYHICLSSHDEVMYRSEADLIMGFNCLAAAVLATDARLLAEGFLTTHHHLLSLTDSKDELVRKERNAYARYFNNKYSRSIDRGGRPGVLFSRGKNICTGEGQSQPYDRSGTLFVY